MAYRLKAHESIPDGVKRIAIAQMDKALDCLTGESDGNPDEAIHSTRKRFKEIRALLRLVRSELGKDVYQQENQCFRDAGRLLSDIRDAKVHLDTLEKLRAYFAEQITDHAFAQVQEKLESQRQAIQTAALGDEITAEVIGRIQAARERVPDWPLKQEDWSVFRRGLKQSYGAGYLGFADAFEDLETEAFHEWRKRVKDLWYHLQILQPIWSDFLEAMIEQTKDLADDLGDDHDLGVLRALLVQKPKKFGSKTEVETLIALIDRRRLELQQSAQFLGKRIYAEKPGAFVKRLETYWHAWRVEVQHPLPGD